MAVTARVKLDLSEPGAIEFPSILQSIQEDESGWLTYEVATATTDQAIPISTTTGITTIDIFFITSNQTISWRQLAADTGNTLDANGFHLLFGTNMTAILISNSSGSTAIIKIYVAGT